MISCKNLQFSYKTRQIIKDISLQFHKGHLYGIIGPNGCGKTTLLKLLIGILKQKNLQWKNPMPAVAEIIGINHQTIA